MANGKERARLYEGDAEVGGVIRFGRYIQKRSGAPEPIEWLVLAKENGRALLISKYALDCQPYDTEFRDVTWETCTLRKWLNGVFLNKAFGNEEQSIIERTIVRAEKNPKYDTPPGNDTTDKVFLLSIQEAEAYFESKDARICKLTDYAAAYGAWVCFWWLRSPGARSEFAASVVSTGVIDYGILNVDDSVTAVRSALWINLES